MSTLYFTADTHFSHENIMKYCNRPYKSVGEMDEVLIANWNNIVGPNDLVWHLGDVAWKDPIKYLKRLNGQIYVLIGNHDSEKQLQECLDEGVIQWFGHVKYKKFQGNSFFLSHYAHRTWRNSFHGSYHLFGHSHGDMPNLGRSMDVGVDAVGYKPIHVSKVLQILDKEADTNHHTK